MKLSYKIDNVKKNNLLNIAFDVSKDKLHLYTETGARTIECISDNFDNRLEVITVRLGKYQDIARAKGFNGLHIICEPTGGYETKLLRIARRMGCHTSYVSGESTHKFKVLEDNTTDKSDERDPRVIFLVARYGKYLTHRLLPDEYEALRHLNRMHEQENELLGFYRNQLHRELQTLFCERDWKEAFWYEKSGRALLILYGANPYTIVRAGYARLLKRMRKTVPGIKEKTLERIWHFAKSSALHNLGHEITELICSRIKDLWHSYTEHEHRLLQIKEQLRDIYHRLLEQGEQLPPVIKGFVSVANLARIAGETGPFNDFSHVRQVLRFGGMNLLLKESGKFKGKRKLSKKGRPRLRLILGQSIFHLIKRDRILGEYYHRLKDRGMPGTKAMAVTSRKLMEILFALSRSGVVFDKDRLFICQSQYKNAA